MDTIISRDCRMILGFSNISQIGSELNLMASSGIDLTELGWKCKEQVVDCLKRYKTLSFQKGNFRVY